VSDRARNSAAHSVPNYKEYTMAPNSERVRLSPLLWLLYCLADRILGKLGEEYLDAGLNCLDDPRPGAANKAALSYFGARLCDAAGLALLKRVVLSVSDCPANSREQKTLEVEANSQALLLRALIRLDRAEAMNYDLSCLGVALPELLGIVRGRTRSVVAALDAVVCTSGRQIQVVRSLVEQGKPAAELMVKIFVQPHLGAELREDFAELLRKACDGLLYRAGSAEEKLADAPPFIAQIVLEASRRYSSWTPIAQLLEAGEL
jgi:hypothetical protein